MAFVWTYIVMAIAYIAGVGQCAVELLLLVRLRLFNRATWVFVRWQLNLSSLMWRVLGRRRTLSLALPPARFQAGDWKQACKQWNLSRAEESGALLFPPQRSVSSDTKTRSACSSLPKNPWLWLRNALMTCKHTLNYILLMGHGSYQRRIMYFELHWADFEAADAGTDLTLLRSEMSCEMVTQVVLDSSL